MLGILFGPQTALTPAAAWLVYVGYAGGNVDPPLWAYLAGVARSLLGYFSGPLCALNTYDTCTSG